MNGRRRVFRIFVSSTFSDLVAERDALQSNVFPRLSELCEYHGARFQAVDLRWGVSTEAGIDQRTMRICLDELRRCRAATPKPNFVVLMGDRYGWEPLPEVIDASEFEAILSAVRDRQSSFDSLCPERDSGGALRLLATWYRRDENEVPPRYLLQPRGGRFVDYDVWELEAERPLRQILRGAVLGLRLSPDARIKYFASATHQEIHHGALLVEDARLHVYGYLRTITDHGLVAGSVVPPTLRPFVDVQPSHEFDAERHRKQKDLQRELSGTVGADNIRRYRASLGPGGISRGHIGAIPPTLELCLPLLAPGVAASTLCEAVWQDLGRMIRAECATVEQRSTSVLEAQAHASFRRDRTRIFVGRREYLDHIVRYLHADEQSPLCLLGVGGSGKSALMAKAVVAANEGGRGDTVVLERFVGVTPRSADVRMLLGDLCSEIAAAFGAEPPELPDKLEDLTRTFHEHLQLARRDRPLLIFLDALDQLAGGDDPRLLAWLPEALPPAVKLVVSVLDVPSRRVREIRAHIPARGLLQLGPMTLAEGDEILSALLSRAGRMLQREQREEVMGRFSRDGLPLYLELAFEEARRWASYDGVPMSQGERGLPADIAGIIRHLVQRLSRPEQHGPLLVAKGLGYLAAARHGLTEEELLDVLSADEEFMSGFVHQSHHEITGDRLPIIVWSRLYYDLAPYLTEREADGTILLGFFQRQLSEFVHGELNSTAEKTIFHGRLARYFGGQVSKLASEDGWEPNIRKCSELPYQQLHGGLWSELTETLSCLGFIEVKCAARLTFDLVQDYALALDTGDASWGGREHVTAFSEFVVREAFVLQRFPGLVVQQALNSPKTAAPARAARALLDEGTFTGAWLELVTPPRVASNVLTTLTGHRDHVTATTFSPDGERILTASLDGTLRLWNARTGAELQTIDVPGEELTACSFLDGGATVAAGTESGGVRTWDAASGRLLQQFAGPRGAIVGIGANAAGQELAAVSEACWILEWNRATGEQIARTYTGGTCVQGCGFSPDGSRVALACLDGSVTLWDLRSGQRQLTLSGHIEQVNSCAFSPDGRMIVSAAGEMLISEDSTLKVWDAADGTVLATFTGHTRGVSCCAFLSDGEQIASGSYDETVRVWSLTQQRQTSCFDAHSFHVTCCGSSPDELRFATGSRDETVIVWNPWVERGSPDISRHRLAINDCAFSPDGRSCVSASLDSHLKIWNAETGVEIRELPGHSQDVLACDTSPDGSRIFSTSRDRIMKIWDAKTGEELRNIVGHAGLVNACAFSPDGTRIATASSDGTLIVWDTRSRQQLRVLEGHRKAVRACAYSPDGRLIASASADESLKLWDAVSGAEIRTMAGHSDYVNACDFSPEGRRLVSASDDHSVRIWDLRSGTCVQTLTGHEDWVRSCAFLPDGQHVASASEDKTLRIWNALTGSMVTALATTGNLLTVAAGGIERRLAVGDNRGRLVLLRFVTADLPALTVTFCRRHGFLTQRLEPSADCWCPWCAERLLCDHTMKALLDRITSTLTAAALPSLELPEHLFSLPILELACPSCQRSIRINPFLGHNESGRWLDWAARATQR